MPASARGCGDSPFALYPGVSTDLSLAFADIPPRAPDGFAHTGTLELTAARDGVRWLLHRFRFDATGTE